MALKVIISVLIVFFSLIEISLLLETGGRTIYEKKTYKHEYIKSIILMIAIVLLFILWCYLMYI